MQKNDRIVSFLYIKNKLYYNIKIYFQEGYMSDMSRRNILKAGLIAPAVLSTVKVDDLYAQQNKSTV